MSRQDVYPCPEEDHDVLDVAADIGYNAIDNGVDPAAVVEALQRAADEIGQERPYVDCEACGTVLPADAATSETRPGFEGPITLYFCPGCSDA